MTKYTREELRGIRKYKRELRARRRRMIEILVKFIVRLSLAIVILSLLSRLFVALGVDTWDEGSPLDKYPTPQSYIDELNKYRPWNDQLTVEDLYGDMYSDTKGVR